MNTWGRTLAVAALLAVSACGGGSSGSQTAHDTASARPEPKAYHSVTALSRAIRASGVKLKCMKFKPAGANDGFALAAASGYCGTGTSGSSVTLYTGTSAVPQAVAMLKSVNPATPLFVGRNWILVAPDAQKLKGKMPGRVDKNGAEFTVQ